MKLRLIIIMFLIGFLNLSAHEHKEHKEVESDKGTIQQMNTKSSVENDKILLTQVKLKKEEPFKIDYLKEVFEHVHNKLVHFPIALSFLAFLFYLLSFKWKQFEFSIKYIVLAASIFSIPVVITGLIQAGNFIGNSKEWIVVIHKILGIVSLINLWIWFIFLSVKPLKKFGWIIAIICVLLIIITGFYGGILAE